MKSLVEFTGLLVWCLWAASISWFSPIRPERDLELLELFGNVCAGAAAFIAVLAASRHDRIGDDRRLNRWDEAVALYGMDCLTDLAVLAI